MAKRKKRKTKREWVREFCKALSAKFPHVDYEVVDRHSRAIEVLVYTPKKNIGDLSRAMAEVTIDILEQGGPHIYVVPDIPRRKAA